MPKAPERLPDSLEPPPIEIGGILVPARTLVSIEIEHRRGIRVLEHGYQLMVERLDDPSYVLVVKDLGNRTADVRVVSKANIIRSNPRLFEQSGHSPLTADH